MSSRDLAIELASSLSQTGSTLAIDDFGTGYSSLAYLKDLNASILKIDKSFVTNIDDSRDNQTIVRSTIKMAHELGMQVVAEGIETAADEHFCGRWAATLARVTITPSRCRWMNWCNG